MSGLTKKKSYTLREMKLIVDYVVEHKAYGEIKGRKMWMDFANSNLTTRTWQSLKETFLKRILPDIHNPYYKLNMEQVRSFRQGCDVTMTDKNKLTHRAEGDESSTSADNPKENGQPTTSKHTEDAPPGEDKVASKISSHDRSSVETVLLEKCYETTEDLRKELESPGLDNIEKENESVSPKSPTKSLRDCITYSEPLTLLAEVLHDFGTDEESSDPDQLKIIIDDSSENKDQDGNSDDLKTTEQSNVGVGAIETTQNENSNKDIEVLTASEFINVLLNDKLDKKRKSKTLQLKKSQTKNKDEIAVSEQKGKYDNTVVDKNICDSTKNNIKSHDTQKLDNNAQNISNEISSTKDSLLPNNQEELNNGTNDNKSTNQCLDVKDSAKSKTKKQTNKRKTSSEENNLESKKQQYSEKLTFNSHVENGGNVTPTKTNLTSKTSEEKNLEPKKQQYSEKLTFNSHVENGGNVTPTKTNLTSKDYLNFERKLDSTSPSKTPMKEHKKNNVNNNQPSPTATKKNVEVNPSQINPCLQSVSLYAEQFSTKKYTDSESDGVNPKTVQNREKPQANNDVTKMAANVVNEVIMLKSHSESESEDRIVKTVNSPMKRHATNPEKDRALANLFGFSNGGAAPSRKRRLSKRTSFHRVPRHNVSVSETSDWTSASDSDYVSPPRGRNSKHNRKYMKPRSARIVSLEEEGGLFVVHGNKIYPLIKDGKMLKNYLTYLPDSDPEEEESHWKLKYIQERKKAEELKKLLEEAKVNSDKLAEERSKSPILHPSTPRSKAVAQNTREQRRDSDASVKTNVEPKQADVTSEQKTVKIKFTKQDEELQLEGHWSQIHPVLQQVVQVFHKEGGKDEPKVNGKNTKLQPEALPENLYSGRSTPAVTIDLDSKKVDCQRKVAGMEGGKDEPKVNGTNTKLQPEALPENLYSGRSTPAVTIDLETHEKVKQKETKIFQEIDEMDQIEEVEPVSVKVVEPNVTVRKRGRPTKLSLASSPENSSKKLKINDEKELRLFESIDKTLSTVAKTQAIPKRSPRSPRILPSEEIVNKNDIRKSGRRSANKQLSQDENETEFEDSSNVFYKFPSPEPIIKKSASASRNAKKGTSNRYMQRGIITSSDTLSVKSINSSLGYQDSDTSPLKTNKRAKRKASLSTMLYRERNRLNRKLRRASNLSLSNNSAGYNVSFNNLPLKTGNNSSLNSDAYRSESYQLLMPKSKHSFKQLEKIDENNPVLSYIDSNNSREVSEHSRNVDNKDKNKEKLSANSSQGSSNMSLPQSPELSIVENISISKSDIANVADAPTINEICANDIQGNYKYRKYSISKVDVSMPLMEQECDLRMRYRIDLLSNETSGKTSSEASSQDMTSENKVTTVTESLLNKMITVKIEEASSSSDSLDEKLKEMLLESAKKNIVNEQVNEYEGGKIAKTKKRSSTPLKKKNATKSVGTKVQTVVEEECMEYCSYGGNKLNQTFLLCTTVHKKPNPEEAISVTSTKYSKPIEKGRRKKDVIKVKITKPKEKVVKSRKRSTKSTCDDSGINVESAICPNGSVDSVELIHNHSETCLKANECMGDSVEIINVLEKSYVSINSKSLPSSIGTSKHQHQMASTADNAILTELFNNNAQDTSTLNNLANNIIDHGGDKENGENYDTAIQLLSLSSLMTDDLSDEPPTDPPKPTKWYLLSDEETNNTNFNDHNFHFTGGLGSKLHQIFPITCAVPNLSAITELSRETDNSCKPRAEVESDTGND